MIPESSTHDESKLKTEVPKKLIGFSFYRQFSTWHGIWESLQITIVLTSVARATARALERIWLYELYMNDLLKKKKDKKYFLIEFYDDKTLLLFSNLEQLLIGYQSSIIRV